MECEYSLPVITCDDHNLYVCRENTIVSSDVDEGKLGTVPFAVTRFSRRNNHYYFLDTSGRLWLDGKLLSEGIQDFNDYHFLGCTGHLWTLEGVLNPLTFPVTRLIGDLLLDDTQTLYDRKGQYITSDVAEAHTDGNEIIIIHQGSERVLEYVGDNSDKQSALRQLLCVKGAIKAVISQGTLLLLLVDGSIVTAGANDNYECGVDESPVLEPRRLSLPLPALDFGFHKSIGWALLADHSIYVWGFNGDDCVFFLQWSKEYFISPRMLPV